jgi:alginate O-acetyltransferase complex protein AlgI
MRSPPVPFVDPFFIWVFLPALCAAYFLVHGRTEEHAPRLLGWSGVVLLAGSGFFVASAAGFGPYRMPAWLPRHAIPLGFAVAACHGIAYVVEVRRGLAARGTFPAVALYLLQFPLLIAGPIVRYRDFSAQLADRTVTLAAVAYGVRRLVIGIIKVAFLAGGVQEIADPVFAARPGTLGAAAAWLGAIGAALQVYFIFSGYADFAIGLSRMFGFRYPENFRRPYTADSIREFWRRWNITLLTWLRDYAGLPIAGQERPTPLLYVKIIVGFSVVGWWHGAGRNSVAWGVLMGTLLALEAAGLGRLLSRFPAAARHAYVLLAAIVGWTVARTASLSAAGAFITSMLGLGGATLFAGLPAVGGYGWTALAVAVLLAGPLIASVSRWRVSVDAATASAVMMLAATALFLWRPIARWGRIGVR